MIEQVIKDFTEVFLNHPPPIPQYNKWTKIWPALSWFACFTGTHLIFADITSMLCNLIKEEDMELGLDAADEVLGMDDAADYRRQEQC